MVEEDGVNSLRISAVRGTALAVAALVLCSTGGFSTLCRAQEAPASPASPGETASAVRDLQDQVRQLRSLVEEMRAENAESRAEMHQLRHDLQATRALLERPATPAGIEPSAAEPTAAKNESAATA